VRGWVYDRFVSGMTAQWYREVLGRLPEHARVLDVGIGTGAALARCADLVVAKDLRIVGLDIDPDYLRRCARNLAEAGLSERVGVRPTSVYHHHGGPYDAVYFSASLMLLPDPVAAIAHTAAQLAPGGLVFATQTFQHRRSPVVERIKPLVRHVTTIQFGRVTYEDEFRRSFADAGVDIVEMYTMRATRQSSYRLAVGQVRQPAPQEEREERTRSHTP
jgi:SAM-dependent methyltransferase